MPTGTLDLRLTDMTGKPVSNIDVEFSRFPGEPGTGGERMHVSLVGPDADLRVAGITCRGGPGTMYRVFAEAAHYRPYGFFQLIRESRNNTASDDVEFWVKPGDVKDIKAPAYADLPSRVRQMLDVAEMITVKPEDRDLAGLRGPELYKQLGPLRKSCLLNLVAKTSDEATTGDCLSQIGAVLLSRQDRFFARVERGFPERLRKSHLFKSAPETLHEPLPGFQMAEGSFKSRDAHANLQVTFMRETVTGELAADIDIDESSGIEHGFEVIRNATFRSRTNPFLIREFLLSADPIGKSLDPGYEFRFQSGRNRRAELGLFKSRPCGMLTAENGVLEATDGGSRRLPAPVSGDDVTISGDGWTFKAAPGWVIREGARRGDYEIVRQQP